MSVISLLDMLEATHTALQARLPPNMRTPKVGIVCGSGLSTLAESLRDVNYIPYEELRGFGKSTGELCIESLNDTN